ncbi:hypothetical protein SEPL_009 [Salmonella phage SE_PL]|nr:hypothetical protein CPT_Munch_420 [Salmonella phage Munch]EAZ2022704.1 hypothetical protein [Salmonella enterica]ECV9083838.1 hypothetical protein [Salmonella enterica subsp. enterica serovar Infantis]MCP0435567.1 hypothetical protein [Salmonella enterica subsp. enterica serovar Mbandaka]QCW19123.1 hypothetical protein 7t3_0608 [Salmonella phage 7t3]QIG62622.1 hypothetical protein SEPL_009 [Salmonella phage SE_PL]
MPELFRPGAHIPKGYTVCITSWENDGDDYDNNFIRGIQTKEEVNQLLHIMTWFSHREEDMGNEDIQHEEILERLHQGHIDGIFTPEFVNKHFDLELPAVDCTDEEFDDWLDSVVLNNGYNDVEDFIHQTLGYPVQYDSDFARMVERVHVYFFEEDLHIPDAPKPITTFDGAYRADKVDWKM